MIDSPFVLRVDSFFILELRIAIALGLISSLDFKEVTLLRTNDREFAKICQGS